MLLLALVVGSCAVAAFALRSGDTSPGAEPCRGGGWVAGWEADGTPICSIRYETSSPMRVDLASPPLAQGWRMPMVRPGFPIPPCATRPYGEGGACFREEDGLIVLPGYPDYPSTTRPANDPRVVPTRPPPYQKAGPGPNGEPHPGCGVDPDTVDENASWKELWTPDGKAACQSTIG